MTHEELRHCDLMEECPLFQADRPCVNHVHMLSKAGHFIWLPHQRWGDLDPTDDVLGQMILYERIRNAIVVMTHTNPQLETIVERDPIVIADCISLHSTGEMALMLGEQGAIYN